MKKLLTILTLALTLCLVCSAALAAGEPSVYDSMYEALWDALGDEVTVPEGSNDVKVVLDGAFPVEIWDQYDEALLNPEKHGKTMTFVVPGKDKDAPYTPREVEIRVKISCDAYCWRFGEDWEYDIVDCTTGGVKTCTICGNTEPIPPMDHLWEVGKVVKEATCDKPGYSADVCKRCGIEKPDSQTEIAATGIHENVWKLDQELTCLNFKTATVHQECKNCGKVVDGTETKLGDAGFTKTEDVTKAKLNAVFPDLVTADPVLHDWDKLIDDKPATCLADATQKRWCKLCNRWETGIKKANTQKAIELVNIEGDCRDLGDIWLVCKWCNGDNDNEDGGFYMNGTTKVNSKVHKHHLTKIADIPDDYDGLTVIGYKLQDDVTGELYEIYHEFDKEEAAKHLHNADVPRCQEALYGNGPCIRCNKWGNVKLADLEDHNWGEWELDTDKDEVGTETSRWISYCQNEGCNKFRVKALADKPVDPCADDAHEWARKTALVCGLNKDVEYECTICGAKKTEDVEKAHEFTVTVSTTPATCKETGVTVKKCANCTALTIETLPVTKNHKLTPVAGKDATCLEEGLKPAYKCDVCGKLFSDAEGKTEIAAQETIAKKEHSYTVLVSSTEATCKADGVKVYKCATCDAMQSESIAFTGTHTLVPVDGKEATCKETGLKEAYKCSVCDKLFSDAEGKTEIAAQETIAKKDHSYTVLVSSTEATCKADGVKVFKCATCDAMKSEPVAFTGTHTLVPVNGKAATCKETGLKEAYKCSVCDKLFADAEGKTEIAAQEIIPVDLTKHVWGDVIVTKAATCEVAGEGLKVCSECKTSENVVIDAIGHDWGEWEVTTPATVEKDGEETRVCKNDTTHKETRTVKFVPTAPAKYEVKDLDYTNPVATGSVELDPETKALTKAYARVTFFVANGDCMIQIVDVDEAGNFTAGAIGNFTHVSVIIVDDADAYGAEEAIEHAHGNGGIEL